ncbi:hypothetical protein DVH05_004542 [Phytophthora capsici]|nr:hypothetical protein DVH05_004542 [Phytophthora capsici]
MACRRTSLAETRLKVAEHDERHAGVDEERARQLSFDLERAYSSFMAFLNK